MFKIANLTQFEKVTKELTKLEAQVRSHREHVVMPYYFQRLQSIVAAGVERGREAIRDAHTPTGVARAGAGGAAGRILHGDFIGNFKHDGGRKISATEYQFRYGWLNSQPDYAVYQEEGFRHWRSGSTIPGVKARVAAREYIEAEMRRLRN